jgi:hypothetical protein
VQRGNTIFTFHGENIELRYSFEGGEKYTLGLYTESQGFFKNTDYGVRIWDNNNKEIKTWKLGEF